MPKIPPVVFTGVAGVLQWLVTHGPYTFTRNPMYLGITGALLSFAVARRSVGAVLPVAGFMVAMNFLQIPREERALSRIFGTDYGQYLQKVPRWLGLVNRPAVDTITN